MDQTDRLAIIVVLVHFCMGIAVEVARGVLLPPALVQVGVGVLRLVQSLVMVERLLQLEGPRKIRRYRLLMTLEQVGGRAAQAEALF